MQRRAFYTEEQLEYLQSQFELNNYPRKEDIRKMSEKVGVTTYQVKYFVLCLLIN